MPANLPTAPHEDGSSSDFSIEDDIYEDDWNPVKKVIFYPGSLHYLLFDTGNNLCEYCYAPNSFEVSMQSITQDSECPI